MTVTRSKANLWLHDVLLQGFLKNGFSKSNGSKSWELTELQYLGLTDDLAKGFLKFSKNPIYSKQFFDMEIGMIKKQARLIAENIGNKDFNLIDIYCGDGLKVVEFIKEFNSITSGNVNIRYCPLNSSQYLLDLAVSNVSKAGFSNLKECKPFLSSGDGRALRPIAKKLKSDNYLKNVVVLLGGVIACFDINEYLFELEMDLSKEDVLIIGNGIRVGDRLVDIHKYKTPAFHDWLKHLMFGLGFDEKDFEFDVRFGNSRVEFVYKLKNDFTKSIDGKKVDFKSGDEFVVAALYKYYSDEFEKFCKMYFSNPKIIVDESNEYALVVCKK
ncbi:MAG: L-histidine N(alpha)-methyltransferase [Nanoarchaeota archaeon]